MCAQLSGQARGDSLLEEEPEMGAVAGTRPLNGRRKLQLEAGFQNSGHVFAGQAVPRESAGALPPGLGELLAPADLTRSLDLVLVLRRMDEEGGPDVADVVDAAVAEGVAMDPASDGFHRAIRRYAQAHGGRDAVGDFAIHMA